MKIPRSEYPKKIKLTGAAAAITAALLLSGCAGIFREDPTRREMRTAAEKGDAAGVVQAAERYLSEHPDDKYFLIAAAEYSGKAGDHGAAADYYGRCLDLAPNDESCAAKLTEALLKSGGLRTMIDGFPAREEIIFKGRRLSEYTSDELIGMSSAPDQIGYRIPEYIYDDYDLNVGESVLPYGITRDMSLAEALEAAGFDDVQAARLLRFRYIALDLTESAAEVRSSRYAAFSQHPEEDHEFRIKKDGIELVLGGFDKVTRYSVGVCV